MFEKYSLTELADAFEKKAEEFFEISEKLRMASSVSFDTMNVTQASIPQSSSQSSQDDDDVVAILNPFEVAVLESLYKKRKVFAMQEIADMCKQRIGYGTKHSVRPWVGKLKKMGYVVMVTRGFYKLSDTGVKICEQLEKDNGKS